MTEPQISIQMEMATRPVQPISGLRVGGPQPWLSAFNLIRFLQKIGMLALVAVLSIICYLVVSNYFVKSVQVVGQSMVPTLKENNRYLLNLWALHNRTPQRNDIVVIRDPGDHGLSVKRVIAVGGESVLFKDGRVYVNGRQLSETYLMPNVRTYTYSQAKEQLITCGTDQFFVLGDIRIVSVDSRSYGPVSRQDVLGLLQYKQ